MLTGGGSLRCATTTKGVTSRTEQHHKTSSIMPTITRGKSSCCSSSHQHQQSLVSKVTGGFRSLSGSPSELWKAYTLKFCDSFSYFSFSIIFTLFASEEFGYTDTQAGTIYGLWGALITVYGLAAGCIIDNVGVAKSLRLGFTVTLLSRCWMFVATTRVSLLLNVCVLLPAGNCLGIPVLTTAIRRYTKRSNRGFAFGLFYVIMNVAALLSGPVVDACTILYPRRGSHDDDDDPFDHHIAFEVDGGRNNTDGSSSSSSSSSNGNSYVWPVGSSSATTATASWSLTGYRLVVLSGIVANIVAVFVAFTVREIKISDDNDDDDNIEDNDDDDDNSMVSSSDCQQQQGHDEKKKGQGTTATATAAVITTTTTTTTTKVSAFRPRTASPWRILQETVQQRGFWKFLTVCLIILNVRMIFRHLDATLPKYMVREFGDDTPKGTIYSINPALIIVLVPAVTAGTSAVDPLTMIHYGTYISAASVFFLAASTTVWSAVVFVILLSIGEAIWSPRLYDYTMEVTAEGREGTYMALSSAPLFLAKLPVGFMSGKLLERYCPKDGPRDSKIMWLIIGLTTATSPVLMTLCWRWISSNDNSDKGNNGNGRGRQKVSQYHVGKEEEEEEEDYHHIDPEFLPLKPKISLPPVRPPHGNYTEE